MHKIYQTFDADLSLDIRVVFLDLTKAIYKVWHVGLMYKIQDLMYLWKLLRADAFNSKS